MSAAPSVSTSDAVPASAAGHAPRRGRLFVKYVVSLVGLVAVVLIGNGALDVWFSYKDAKQTLVRIQHEKAESAAQRIAAFVEEIQRQIGWTTHAQWSAGTVDQRRFDFVRLLRQVPAITELTQIDSDGKEQLKVSRLAMDVVGSGTDLSQDPKFTEPVAHKVWFSPVYFRKESEPYMTIAIAHAGRKPGVTVADVNLKLIWDVVSDIKVGKAGYAYVVGSDGRLIAHPDISLVLRNTDLSTLPQVKAALADPGAVRDPGNSVTISPNYAAASVLTAHAAIPALKWLVFVEQPASEALEPLYELLTRSGILLGLGLLLAAVAGGLLARRMVVPIRELQQGAERLGAGELDHRIALKTGDEIEALADRFNRMGAQLQDSYATLEAKVEVRTHELAQALEQQTATSDVLKVISSSPGELNPVFDAMLENATRICRAEFGRMALYDGGVFKTAAVFGGTPEYVRFLEGNREGHGGLIGQMGTDRRAAQLLDAREGAGYRSGNPFAVAAVELGGARSAIAVPLLKEGALIGALVLYRTRVEAFTESQIALVQTFADQAVIAIENARLITETREALEQQTATAQVLGVINSSPGDLAPVFEAMLEKAMRLCEAAFGFMMLYDGQRFHPVAQRGVPPALAAYFAAGADKPGPGEAHTRVLAGEDLIHSLDYKDEDPYRLGNPLRRAVVDLGGARTALVIALRKERALLGTFTIYRQEVRPFTERQIALLQNFATQAVIALENSRLMTETREALERQTATAEVLQVINASPGDLTPVFDAMLDKALRLCEAAFGFLATYDGSRFEHGAQRGVPDALAEYFKTGMDQPRPGDAHWRLLAGEDLIHNLDLMDDDAYRQGSPLRRAVVDLGGAHSALIVALRKEGVLLGSITIYRKVVRPFSDKQIALLQNFAAQAVIAIENARLLGELRSRNSALAEALEYQTATSEVLRTVASSPDHLQPVFEAMLEKATALCEAKFGFLALYEDGAYRYAAGKNLPSALDEMLRAGPHRPGSHTALRRVAQNKTPVHIEDVREDIAYTEQDPWRVAAVEQGGARAQLVVPLLKKGELIGAFIIYRQEPRRFADNQIALVTTFADQAVIAIENARLITETREALEQQTATAEVLQVINSSPGNLAPVFDAMLEKATRLCEAAFGILLTYDGERFHHAALRGVPTAYAEFMREHPPTYGPETAPGRLVAGERLVHVIDMTDSDAYRSGDPARRAIADLAGARTVIVVPLTRDDRLQGAIIVFRQEVRPFSDKQIALLQNFAAQAVIAMENARLINETREALEQQTATAEVLHVISRSRGDLKSVFQAALQNATRICEAKFGVLQLYEDGGFRIGAIHNAPPAFAEAMARREALMRPTPQHPFRRMVATKAVVQIANLMESPAYKERDRGIVMLVESASARTFLAVPMLKDNEVAGVIAIYRQEVRPFTDKQIAVVVNFANQAVIAIENARLLSELRDRQAELARSVDELTATSDVLKIISRSSVELETVLDTLVETAARLCRADQAWMFRRHSDGLHYLHAAFGASEEAKAFVQTHPFAPDRGTTSGRVALERRTVHIADVLQDPEYTYGEGQKITGFRTMLGVPLLREDALVGVFVLSRTRVAPFTDKEIELVTTFADQAVIAIENARLFEELRDRSAELARSVDELTATSDVLKIISRSSVELQTVLDTLVETAARLCHADHAHMFRRRGERYHVVASSGASPEFRAWLANHPFEAGRGTATGRAVVEGRTVHVPDVLADPEYVFSDEGRRLGDLRTNVAVPLLRGDTLIGVFTLVRTQFAPFSEKEIELVTTFADQAVIAIENARLFEELRDRSAELARSVEELTTLREVGQAVSSTLDLWTVLDTIVGRAVALSGAEAGAIYRYRRSDRQFRLGTARGLGEELVAKIRDTGIREEETTALKRAINERAPVQLPDLEAAPHLPLRDLMVAAGFRAVLMVPLVAADRVFGVLSIQKKTVGEFPESTVKLMQTFASQSVLAIQNARLFREVEEQGRALALASQHKSQFLANMSHELRTPLNAVLGYAELLADGIYGELGEKARGVLERIQSNGKHLLGLINDVLDLSKIEAGQLTLALDDYAMPAVVHSVVSATESLAKNKGLTLVTSVPPVLPMGRGDERRLTQVLLNLVGNAIKFTDKGSVGIEVKLANNRFEIAVKDTGPGIAKADQARIFEEFQQVDNSSTRQKGGTGLGLAISRRIVEMHGGTLTVDSEPGKGSTFLVTVPVQVEPAKEVA